MGGGLIRNLLPTALKISTLLVTHKSLSSKLSTEDTLTSLLNPSNAHSMEVLNLETKLTALFPETVI